MQHPWRPAFALVLVLFARVATSHAAPRAPKGSPELDLDPSKIPHERVRALLARAFAEERAGNVDAARATLELAGDIEISAAVVLERGLVELRAGRPDRALVYLERGMTLFSNPVLPRPIAYYERKIAEAKAQVATLYVFVDERSTTLFVDGEPALGWPFVDRVHVMPGTHVLRASKLGFVLGDDEVTVASGETRDVVLEPRARRIRDVKIDTLTAPVRFEEPAQPPPKWAKPMVIAGLVGTSISASALAAGIATWSAADHAETTTSAAKAVTIAAGLSTSVGLVATTIGLVSRASPRSAPPVVVAVQASSHGAGMRVGGAF